MKNYDSIHDLANTLSKSVDLKDVRLGQEFYYSCLPLCVIDAVFSINSKYKAVQNVVTRFSDKAAIERFRPYGSLPIGYNAMGVNAFLSFLDSYSDEELAGSVFENRQRTSPSNGILKAGAVREFAQVLASFDIDHFEDMNHVVNSEQFEKCIKSIKGQTSGISLAYFYMLAGSEDRIKPDRHVVSYLQMHIPQEVNSENAIEYLREVLLVLRQTYPNLSLRQLDYAIWSCQSKKR